MNALESFLPQDRAWSLATGTALPDRPQGAALFADVSGFTALTGALVSELGRKRGAEELLVHINRAYDHLIHAVHEHAGSVVGFAGDSITCWFDDAPPMLATPPTGASRAWTAARRMHEALGNLPPIRTPGGTEVRLAVKIAIAAGAARRFAVGDPARQRLDALAGETLSRMAALERTALIGQTVTDPPLEGTPLIERCPWPLLPSLDSAPLSEWVLPAVADQLAVGGAFLGELRPAVPMFIGFDGIAYDTAPEAGAQLDAWVRWAQQVLARFGGEVIQLTIGDKGSNLYAAFGAPVAHEDDIDRACAAALALHEIPVDLRHVTALRIGVAQGQVFAGACGSAARRCYAVMGEPVNLAARLMMLAGAGETIAEERVIRGATRHHFDAVRTQSIKGRNAPLQVAALRGAATTGGAPGPTPRGGLIGREREQAELLALLASVDSGRPSAAIVEGDAGIGKSRLVAEVVAACRAAGRRVLVGQGSSVERNRAYQGWRQVLMTLLQEPLGAPHPADAVHAHVTRLDPALAPMTGLLTPLLGMALRESPAVARMDAAVRAEQTRHLLLQLLADAGPLVIVMEDAHWLDSSSWAMVRAVQASRLPVGLVVATRPLRDAAREGPLHEVIAALAEHPDTLRVALGPLPADQALALARQRIGVVTLPAAVSRIVAERAEGNPLFVEELTQSMLEAGILRIEEGHGILADPTGAAMEGFPDTLEGLVTSRLDRLPPAAQRAAKVGSVIGRVFGLAPLRAVFPVPEELPRLPESLQELERLDIALTEEGNGEEWVFRHAIIHEVVYGTLPFAQRQTLHRAVAEWYQQAEADDLEPYLPLLAHHWERADAADEALAFGERAGVQALGNFANREAAEYLERVIARLDAGQGGGDPLRRVRVLRQLAEALYLSGDVPRAGDRLNQLFTATGRSLPRSAPAGLLQLARAILRQAGHRWLPGLLLRDPTSGRAERVEVARALALLTFTYYYTGDLIGAFLANFQGLNLAEQARGDAALAPVLAQAFTNVGAVCTNIFGMPRTGSRYFARAETVAVSAQAAAEHGYLDQVRGMVAISTGAIGEAEAPLLRAADRFEHLGNGRKREEVGYSLSQLYQLQGRLQEAEGVTRRVVHSSRRRESTQALMLGLAQLGSILLWMDRSEEAQDALDEAAGLHAREPYLAERTFVGGQLALLHARAGRTQAAAARLEDVRMLLRESRPNPVAIEGYAAAAEAALRLHATGGGAGLVATAREALTPLQQLSTVGARVYRARRWFVEGLLAHTGGRQRAARRHWRRGLAFATARGLVLDEALTRLALLESDGNAESRRGHAERIGTLAAALPAPWLRQQIDTGSSSTTGH